MFRRLQDRFATLATMTPQRLPDCIHPQWASAGRTWPGRLCRMLLHAMGWRLVFDFPRIDKAVAVFYPHTSNWDFVIGLLAKFGGGVPAIWAGKDNLFRWPFCGLWRRLGGIPVNRREHTGFVGQMTAEFSLRSAMLLAIAPEGTRRRTEFWKSGFYRVALSARVPIALAFIDFRKKEVGVGGLMMPTGDIAADMAVLWVFYAGKTGRHPDQSGPIALKPGTVAPVAP
ncbi:MAG: 1-acyl-sn-glycerol-3-phosphate acyltransferase [Betaproteobacteria bacterium]